MNKFDTGILCLFSIQNTGFLAGTGIASCDTNPDCSDSVNF